MQPNEINKIIESVINNEYDLMQTIVLMLSSVSIIFSIFIGAYLKKKAEHVATKEDFDSILEQLKTQVRTTEEIKSEFISSQAITIEKIKHEISNDYWKAQEWKKIRMGKLEVLMNCTYEIMQKLDVDIKKLEKDFIQGSHDLDEIKPSQLFKIEMLSKLYFKDELMDASANLSCSYQYMFRIIAEKSKHTDDLFARRPSSIINTTSQWMREIQEQHYIVKKDLGSLQKKVEQVLDKIAMS